MADFYPFHVACVDLLQRTNQWEAAADDYERSIALCGNSAECAYLQRRLDEMLVRSGLERPDEDKIHRSGGSLGGR